MTTDPDRQRPADAANEAAEADDLAGLVCWNALSEARRLFWRQVAGGATAGASSTPAWKAYKSADAPGAAATPSAGASALA